MHVLFVYRLESRSKSPALDLIVRQSIDLLPFPVGIAVIHCRRLHPGIFRRRNADQGILKHQALLRRTPPSSDMTRR